MNIYKQISSNRRKSWLLVSLSAGLLIVVGYVFSHVYNNPAWLYVALIYTLVSSFISYWWSDKIVLAMSKAKPVSKEDSPQLYRLVENLSLTAGLTPMPRIYIINDPAPNAFATGRNVKQAAVAFTSGLLSKLDKAELEGVIAHELSHIGNQDMLLATLVSVLVGTIVLLADWFARWTIWGGSRQSSDNNKNPGQIGLILSVIALVLALLAPLFAQLIQLAVSRKREFLADADAVLLTRHPEGLISALEKISQDNTALSTANRATAHLYFSTPFRGNKVAKLFMSHPPIAERIRAIRQTD